MPQILINRELVGDGHNFDAELLGDCDAVVQHLMHLLDAGGAVTPSPSVPPVYTASRKFAHRWIFKNGVDDIGDDEPPPAAPSPTPPTPPTPPAAAAAAAADASAEVEKP